MSDLIVRQNIVAICYWGTQNRSHFTYSEGQLRMEAVHKPFVLPIISDCSSWVTSVYCWSGVADPNGRKYNGSGYTGTLISHGKLTLTPQIGDIVVYGAGTGEHTAIVVKVDGANVLTCSMGQNGDPSYVWTKGPNTPSDGRTPQRFFTYDLTQIAPMHTPPIAPK